MAVPTRGTQDLEGLAAEVRRSSSFNLAVFLDLRASDVADSQHFEVLQTGVTGYSSIRNFILETALERQFSWVLFFDDDQLPCGPEWGQQFARSALVGMADVVLGPVVSAPTVSPWVTEDDGRSRALLDARPGSYGGDVYSGNTLVSLDFIRRTGLRFDTRFDRSGGEDTDFFRRARSAGALVDLAPSAYAIESQDPTRFLPTARFRAGWQSRRRKRLLGQALPRDVASRCGALVRAMRWALTGVLTGSRPAIGRAAFWLGATVAWGDLEGRER